jgi:hypothetical protein
MKILMRAIKSKHKNWTDIADELKRTIDRDVKPALLEYFQRIVKTWEHKPEFKAMKRVEKGGISIYVYPTGPNANIWRYVSQGTRPHVIRPKRPGGKLAFPWGGYGSYKPHTSLGGHYGGPGIVVNPQPTVLPEVQHPGTEAREFERHISRWYRPKFTELMRNAIRRGARR